VLAVDNNLASAEETAAMARQSGGECAAFEPDVAREATPAAAHWPTRGRAVQAYLGHRNIPHTVRYTELSPTRFEDFWLSWARAGNGRFHSIDLTFFGFRCYGIRREQALVNGNKSPGL